MNIVKNTFSVSPLRFTAVFMGMAAVWLFAPEIVHAAVTFGEMGENVADNAKGVAQRHHTCRIRCRSRYGRMGHCGYV